MTDKTLLLLRFAIAALFLIHGIYRVATGIVDDFGGFFSSLGWPFGPVVAWTVTSLEIFCSVLILLGRLIIFATLYLITQTIFGILLVHLQFGWFVVGAGRNGMEYSVLLIVCLIILASNSYRQNVTKSTRHK